jgi:tRNA(Arg) A34 adenosine deaminase TadA
MENLKQKFMNEALLLAKENLEARNGGPFGCVIVKDGQVISTGFNEVLSHNDPTSHAEIVAIRKACKALGTYHLEGCEVYSSCEPCPMCLGAIYWARPEKLYYSASRHDAEEAGFSDKFIYEEIQKTPETRTIIGEQILQEEGKAVLHRWKELGLDIIY